MARRKRKKLRPVPHADSKEHTIINAAFIGPVFTGAGDTDFVCASCDAVLAEGINEGQIRAIVVKCGSCGKYSSF